TVGLATYWGVYTEAQKLFRHAAEDRYLGTAAAAAGAEQRAAALKELDDDARSAIGRTEMAAMFLVSIGSGIGLLSFGPISIRIGRRGAFALFCLAGLASALTLFLVLPHGPLKWAALPVFGCFATGMHAGYAVYFPELFPTRVRGTGGGFCFNGGRFVASPTLLLSGWLVSSGMPIAHAASLLSLLYLLGIAVLIVAPETKGKDLPT
ncbi:MAG: hypothetical protein ACOY3P_02670, partial [Planctomycetota bacterium]